MNTKLIGRWGEEQAAAYLKKKGYKILAAGYTCRFGEIDLITQKSGVTVFVEVKLRKNDGFAAAADNVTPAKMRRIKTEAQMWLAQTDDDIPARFDVVEVYAENPGKKVDRINHIEDAFE